MIFDDHATRWQCIFIHIYIYITYSYVDHDYDMDFHVTVMLRSTTAPYGRPVIEVAYGKMIFHSIETVCKMIVRESGWSIDMMHRHVRHIRINTSMGSVYM